MGFEIMVVTLVRIRVGAITPETKERAKEYAKGYNHVIFSSLGEGGGCNGIAIGFHKNFTSYLTHLKKLRADWKGYLEVVSSFIVSIGEAEFKSFSLKHLGELPL